MMATSRLGKLDEKLSVTEQYDLIVPHVHMVKSKEGQIRVSYEGRARLDKAVELFLRKRGKLLFSPVGPLKNESTTIDKSLSYYSKEYVLKNYPEVTDKDFIVLPYAFSTVGEVGYTLNYMLETNLKSVIFVTSDYHMNRIKTLVHELYPSSIKVGFESVEIYLSQNERQALVEEENKKLIRDIERLREFKAKMPNIKPYEY
jgi:hypothetical protein